MPTASSGRRYVQKYQNLEFVGGRGAGNRPGMSEAVKENGLRRNSTCTAPKGNNFAMSKPDSVMNRERQWFLKEAGRFCSFTRSGCGCRDICDGPKKQGRGNQDMQSVRIGLGCVTAQSVCIGAATGRLAGRHDVAGVTPLLDRPSKSKRRRLSTEVFCLLSSPPAS